jgi:formylglycine-generating enzyme required for sulfatase activity
MEYLAAGDFQRKVLEGGTSTEQVHSIIQEVGQALQYAHGKAVIHRDVKPPNILLDDTGTAKLTDFDLVRAQDSFVRSYSHQSLGTFFYSAPEVLKSGKDADVRCDVFSLGMTAVFGFKGSELDLEDFRQPELAIDRLPVPGPVKSVLKRATDWNPERRFAGIGDFVAELKVAAQAPEFSSATAPLPVAVPEQGESKTMVRIDSRAAVSSVVERSPIGIELKRIPAGEFLMGSPDSDPSAWENEKPRHRVQISRPFYLGVYPVTQGEYAQVVRKYPSYFSGAEKLPVEWVSWFEAVEFCNAVSANEGLPPFYAIDGEMVEVPDWDGPGYRLPAEAEWEYACRAGTSTRYSFGDDEKLLGEFAWYWENSGGQTHPVGTKKPNGSGIHDMHGNVWEWCWDWFGAGYYKQSPRGDPRGPAGTNLRVARGGSWNYLPRGCPAALRRGSVPGYRSFNLGMRVARFPAGR